jgi:hypothetical protein
VEMAGLERRPPACKAHPAHAADLPKRQNPWAGALMPVTLVPGSDPSRRVLVLPHCCLGTQTYLLGTDHLDRL